MQIALGWEEEGIPFHCLHDTPKSDIEICVKWSEDVAPGTRTVLRERVENALAVKISSSYGWPTYEKIYGGPYLSGLLHPGLLLRRERDYAWLF